MIWLKRMFFEQKAKEELYTLDNDGTHIKVETTDDDQSDKEKKDDDVPELLDDKTKVEEAKELDDELIAGGI